MTGVRLEGVSKSWAERPVLRDVSFSFDVGESWLLSGRSGGGKSTLLNLIAGYVQPDEGRVERPSRVGYLLQGDVLMSGLTAAQHVRVAAAATDVGALDDRVRRTLAEVGIAHRADVPVEYLSGGERQRAQFATLIVADAEVVLLDEPTSSLDPSSRGEIAALIDTVFGDKLRIIVSHDESIRHELAGVRALRLTEGRLHAE